MEWQMADAGFMAAYLLKEEITGISAMAGVRRSREFITYKCQMN
jgi:hypothetical protein